MGVVSRSVSEALEGGVSAGAVVCASLADGPVPGWLVVEETAAAGAQRQCAIVRLDGCSVVSAGALSEVKVAGDPVPTEGEMPAWAPALAGSFWAARRARGEAEATRSALTALQRRVENIVDAAHEYADENSLCERFDDFMMEQGLRPRSREYMCVVDVTVRGPDGRTREAFSRRTCTDDGNLDLALKLPVNAQRGRWRVKASDPWSGQQARATFVVRP